MAITQLPPEGFEGGANLTNGVLQAHLQSISQEVAVVALMTGSLPGTVVVQSLADFPAPSGGLITLADNTLYLVVGAVNVGGNDFLMGQGTVLRGFATPFRDQLISSSAGAFIRATNPAAEITVHRLTLVTSGTMFACDCAVVSVKECQGSCAAVGTVRGSTAVLFDTVGISGFSTGLTFTGANGLVGLLSTRLQQLDGTGANRCLDLGTATFAALEITSCAFVTAASGVALGGLASSGNMPAGRALVDASSLNGPGTPLAGITIDDLRWQFLAVEGVLSSFTIGSFEQDPGIEPTVITGPTKLLITTSPGSNRRMTHTADNQLTYNTLQSRVMFAAMCLGVEKTGGAIAVDFGLAVNGSIVKRVTDIEVTGTRQLVSCNFELPALVATDTVEIFADTAGPTTVNVVGATLLLR